MTVLDQIIASQYGKIFYHIEQKNILHNIMMSDYGIYSLYKYTDT